MTTTRYESAQSIMDRAAIELGLSAPGSSVYSSTDTNVILLRNLLNTAGQELALMHPWPALIKEHTITVTNPGDTGEYTLPADFNGLVPQTGWDRSNQVPLGGPLSVQLWQYRQAQDSDPVWIEFRLDKDVFRTLPAPPANGTSIAFEYYSRYWVCVTGSTTLSKAAPTLSTDVVFLEPIVIISLLKLRFREARGDDTTAELTAFERRFEAAASRVTDAPVLNVAGSGTRGLKLINSFNIPDTGYGT